MIDPQFPYLNENQYFNFPNSHNKDQIDVISGGNYSPGLMLSAYQQGYFPWNSEGDKSIKWYFIAPRMIIKPDEVHISKTMLKIIKKNIFTISINKNFKEIIDNCESVNTQKHGATWLNNSLKEGLFKLHELGYAHSVGVYHEGILVGGLYGLLIGDVFFGESMFSKMDNSSKFGFIKFSEILKDKNIKIIDCQYQSDYMASLGGVMVSKFEFKKYLSSEKVKNRDKIIF